MDFDEFVNRLYKIGWRATGDAQHTQIRELWGELIQEGLRVHLGNPTTGAVDEGYCEHDWSFPPEFCPVCNKRVPVTRLRH